MVNDLISKCYDINAQNEKLGSPLSIAALFGHTRAVHELILANADLEIHGTHVPSAPACSLGHVESAKRLIVAGASLTFRCGWSPFLKDADDAWQEEVIDRDGNRRWYQGEPFVCAIETESMELVQLLLEAGASPHTQIHEVTWSLGDPSKREPMPAGVFPLCMRPVLAVAASKGSVDIIHLLLRHGAKADAYVGAGDTALMEAVDSVNVQCLKALLDAGALANPYDPAGRPMTPLHVAVQKDGPEGLELVRILLDHGADVRRVGSLGSTSLHVAVYNANAEALALLLNAGAEPSPTDDDGYIPLHVAALRGKCDHILVLSEKGAKMDHNDK